MRDLAKMEWVWKIGQRHLVCVCVCVEAVYCEEKLDDGFALI